MSYLFFKQKKDCFLNEMLKLVPTFSFETYALSCVFYLILKIDN